MISMGSTFPWYIDVSKIKKSNDLNDLQGDFFQLGCFTVVAQFDSRKA